MQTAASSGHTDIQAYSDSFKAVGCTASVDARNNTSSTYTSSNTGLPIYWINGLKVADNYQDFYDGSWDAESNSQDKNELGNNGPNTTNSGNYPFTGCDHDGTEAFLSSASRALGHSTDVRVGRPGASGQGPIGSSFRTDPDNQRPMYGLSGIFEVGTTAPEAPTGLTGTANGETEIKLSWTAPSNNGGDAITGYKVEVSANGTSGWSNVVADTASTDTTYSHTGLSAGNTRHYRVSAINSAGTSDASNVVGATTAAANVLVSNTGQNVDRTVIVSIGNRDKTHSQGFNTGPNPGGYNLTSVGVYVDDEHLETGETFTVHIYTADNTGAKDALTHTLTSPASYTDVAVNTFTAPAGATLDTSTDYLVVFEGTGNATTDFKLGATPSNGQDRGTKGGWEIEDAYRVNGTSTSSGNSYQVSVNGSAIPTEVAATWALIPTGVNAGDTFRLLFLSSTGRDGDGDGIGTYNNFIKNRAGAGHTDIQTYKDDFKVVGCTEDDDATDNTRTIYTTSDKGVPIYWLNGAKAADDYEDFYDGSWDDEANDKDESGNDGPDTSLSANRPWTGCDHDGTSEDDDYLGDSATTIGRPNDSGSANGPLSSANRFIGFETRPLYGLSELFQVAAPLSSDATLSALTVNDGTNDLTLTPTFVSGTYVYETDVANTITTATLTATPNHSEAEVTTVTLDGTAIADTNFTDGITVPSLVVGDNEIVVTVTAENATTQAYTATVTRAAANSAPVFSMSTETRTLAENTASGQNIGGTFTATDSDGDTITYTLEGTDEASFDLATVSSSAQIRTKTGVTYNFEVQNSYTVVVKADDGNSGTATVTVTITITDVTEAPGRPAAPTVSGTAGTTTSLTVSWNEPDNTGPAINSYDLQYRQGTSGNFTNGPQNVNGLTTTIPNLSANTSYQVQVRATSNEGDSPWSPSGTGSTSSPPVTPPGQVTGVNITASDQTLQVNWTRVTGATGYKVQWKSGGQSYSSGSRQATISSGSTTSRTISSLNNDTEYTVRVIATKTGASDGTPSVDAMGTPTASTTVPTAPRDLNATAVGNNRINLSWDAPSSIGGSAITGYKIEVSNNGRTNWTTRVANTGNSSRTHSHTGLSTGDTRHYRVSAINSSGTGPTSNVARATTGLPTVSIRDATTTEGGDIVFVITISPPIDGFLSVGYGTGIDSLPSGSMGAKKDDDYVPHHPAGADVQIGYGLTSVELTFTTVDDDLVEGTEKFAIGLYPSSYEGTAFSYGKRTAIATIRDDENGGQAYQDSVRGDTSTNHSISPGNTVQNRIETVNDADWYRTTLTKDRCYQIKVEGSSADETLTLQYPAVRGVYRSDGTHIMNTYENADGLGTTAISNVKLDTTATYYIAAGLYRFENGGTFRMSLTDLGTTDTSCGAAKPGGPMQLSVADASMSEASDRRKYMSFIVTLDRRADTEVTVNYTTVNGTATAGQDYEATTGTLVFDRGDVQKTVYVPIEYDSNDEVDETLLFILSNPTIAQIERGLATGTIMDYE